jgi:hypothetical protein
MAWKTLSELEFTAPVFIENRKGVRVPLVRVTAKDADIRVDEELGVIAVGLQHRSMHSPSIIGWTLAGAAGVAARKAKE